MMVLMSGFLSFVSYLGNFCTSPALCLLSSQSLTFDSTAVRLIVDMLLGYDNDRRLLSSNNVRPV